MLYVFSVYHGNVVGIICISYWINDSIHDCILVKTSTSDPLSQCILSILSLTHIVPHRGVFMFQFWKSITWWRVPSSLFSAVWVFSKDSRWLGILLSKPIYTLPLLISVPWYTLFNHPPAALVSIFWRKCLNKLFILVAIGKEEQFQVSPQSLLLASL